VSTTTTTQGPSEASCAMTAILSLPERTRHPSCEQPSSIWSIGSDEIVEIVEAGIEDVFDIEVERTHNFIANGLEVSNTRWHEDDLAGWLLGKEADEPERWHIVDFPAIAEPLPVFPSTCTIEADFRKEGEALCPERYPLAKLEKIHRRIGEHFWASLYQQRPAPREGGLFKRAWFTIVDANPAQAQRVRWWDTGATHGGGDYTAGVLIAKAAGIYYIEDVTRGQWSAGEVDKVIVQTAQLDKQRYGHVTYWQGQEPGSGGKRQAEAFIRLLAGYDVHAQPETGSKEVRAAPFAAQAEAGNVRLVRGAWNVQYIDELCSFPNGAHDDDVDASSGAFGKLTRPAPWKAHTL
jgi:predicted phage terminase large subunit-like protein